MTIHKSLFVFFICLILVGCYSSPTKIDSVLESEAQSKRIIVISNQTEKPFSNISTQRDQNFFVSDNVQTQKIDNNLKPSLTPELTRIDWALNKID